MSGDQFFKKLAHNKYILASLVGDLVTEFEGLSREQVLEYLPVEGNGDSVKGSKTELVAVDEGPIYLDSVFEIGSPKGKLGLVVAIEGQGPSMATKPLAKRQLVYLCRLVSEQGSKNGTKDELYDNLKKTICIWVHLSPSAKKRNRTFRHRMYCTEDFVDSAPELSQLDDVEVIELNLGDRSFDNGGKSRSIQGILNTLFDRGLEDSEKKRLLEHNYKISLSESIITEARGMGALAEEYEMAVRNGYKRGLIQGTQEGIEQGIEQGLAKGIEQGEKAVRDSIIAEFTQLVLQVISEKGISPEAAVDTTVVLESYRQPVLNNVMNKIENSV